jgi:hypothetical protein
MGKLKNRLVRANKAHDRAAAIYADMERQGVQHTWELPVRVIWNNRAIRLIQAGKA